MNEHEKLAKTAEILTLGKALTPDRFPKPSREAGAAWAKSLDRLLDQMPEDIWEEAVHLWAMELVGDDMITPKELKKAVYLVRDRWESDPIKRQELDAHRKWQEEERDRQIANGTFAQIRGYKPRQQLPHTPPSKLPSDLLDGIGKDIA